MRWLAIVVLVLGCKKQEQAAPDPMPTSPSSGHSITKVNEPGEEGSGTPSGKSLQSAAQAKEQGSAAPSGAPADAQLWGGNGKPAFRDDMGRVHGPGGPVFMGNGPDCTDKLDHCLRDGVWFAVGNIRPGSLYRATAVFEFEGKWWNFHGDEDTDHPFLLRTKVAEKVSDLVPGEPVLWFIHENSSKKWVDNEMDALTSSRWEVGVVDGVSSDTFRVKGFDAPVPIETARVIVEKKSS